MFQQKKPTEFISATQVFQCLLIEGENCGTDALRQAQKFVISDDEFNHFVERHSKLSCLVPESNEKVNELSDFSFSIPNNALYKAAHLHN